MTALSITSDYLKPLEAFGQLKASDHGYSLANIENVDPYIASGAWCSLLATKTLPTTLSDRLVAVCRYGAVRTRAFEVATESSERALARSIAATPVEPIDAIRQRRMLAELAFDYEAMQACSAALFLATGRVEHLLAAAREAEQASGWQAALPWAVRAMAVAPADPRGFGLTLSIASSAGQADILQEVADILTAVDHYPRMATIFSATAAMARGEARACLDTLAPLTDAAVKGNRAIAPLIGHIRALRATAHEKLGDYRAAYALYVAVNSGNRAGIDASTYYAKTSARDRFEVPALAGATRHDIVQMVGFPRSGTTLLENALAAHPAIETFEEIPALRVAYALLDTMPEGSLRTPELFEAAKRKYHEQIDMRRQRPAARLLVDKMPMRSAETPFLVKLFPEWRYIFSIRHPFDVVLSCFKQRFKPNVAMENFRSIEDAVRLYDYTMTRWFQTFSMDDPRVAYVRYEELVLDFETTMRRVLGFIGLEWDDAINGFADAAAKRAARTPSYTKVRQGLGIGVQSAWRNYGFAFADSVADPLRKWAEVFGYHTDPRTDT